MTKFCKFNNFTLISQFFKSKFNNVIKVIKQVHNLNLSALLERQIKRLLHAA